MVQSHTVLGKQRGYPNMLLVLKDLKIQWKEQCKQLNRNPGIGYVVIHDHFCQSNESERIQGDQKVYARDLPGHTRRVQLWCEWGGEASFYRWGRLDKTKTSHLPDDQNYMRGSSEMHVSRKGAMKRRKNSHQKWNVCELRLLGSYSLLSDPFSCEWSWWWQNWVWDKDRHFWDDW